MKRRKRLEYPPFGRQGFLAVVLGLALMVSWAIWLGGPSWVMPDKAKWTKSQTEMGEIQKALCLHAHQHKGVYPDSLGALQDEYFKRGVPKDPFTQGDYLYQRTATGFCLTCLGKDQAEGGDTIPDTDIVFDEKGLVEH